jgi:hypothetical protein
MSNCGRPTEVHFPSHNLWKAVYKIRLEAQRVHDDGLEHLAERAW